MAKTTQDSDKDVAQEDAPKSSDKAESAVASKGAGDSATPSSSDDTKSAPETTPAAKASDKPASSLDHNAQPQELSLRAFLRVCGERPDQTAGFARYAEINKQGRFPIDQWKQALEQFKRAPVR